MDWNAPNIWWSGCGLIHGCSYCLIKWIVLVFQTGFTGVTGLLSPALIFPSWVIIWILQASVLMVSRCFRVCEPSWRSHYLSQCCSVENRSNYTWMRAEEAAPRESPGWLFITDRMRCVTACSGCSQVTGSSDVPRRSRKEDVRINERKYRQLLSM